MPMRRTVDLRRASTAADPSALDPAAGDATAQEATAPEALAPEAPAPEATAPGSGDDARAAGPTAADGVRAVPEATVGRLPGYLHALRQMAADGITTVSSQALAAHVGVSAAKVRKDLSYLGSFGTRGVGYDVGYLVHAIAMTLGVADDWEVAIAGLGNLGRALAGYVGFAPRGLRVTALFEVDPAVVGTEVAGIRIAVIAAPAAAAQSVADLMVAGGVTSLLSFASATIAVPEGVSVRHVDLSAELQILGFREYRRREGETVGPARSVAGARS